MIRPALVRCAALIVLSLAATVASAQEVTAPPPNARLRPDGWFAPRKTKNRPGLPKEVTRAYIIPIQTEITDALLKTLARKAVQCRVDGAQLVIFDMDTPGGSLKSMENITRLILDEELRDIYTVVYVNPNAFSAGAMISLACSEITMAPTARIGDAMPIMIGPQGIIELPKAERIKTESGAKAIVRSVAARNGYSKAIGNAMVTIAEEVWLVRNMATGELRAIDANDPAWARRVRNAPARKDTPVTASPTQDGKAAEWKFLSLIDGPGALATFTADEAVEAGLVDHVFANMDDLLKYYNVTVPPTRLDDNWSESLVLLLTSPVVASTLFFLALLCGFIEFNIPGFGIAGALAIVFLAVLFGAPMLTGMAVWWEVALIVVGLGLIAMEVFVIPGFGVAGIAGGLCLLVGAIGAIGVPNPPDKLPIPETSFGWETFADSAFSLGVAFVLAVVTMPLVSRLLPRIPITRKLIIGPAGAAVDPPVAENSAMMRVAVGDSGVVHSVCRPVGKVRFDNDILDAMSEGDIIAPGAAVRVLRREGNRLIVERIE